MDYAHTPVLLKEVLALLKPSSGDSFIDGTLGGGGYTQALLEKIGPTGKLLGIDSDRLAIANWSEKKLAQPGRYKNVIVAQGNYRDLEKIVKALWPPEYEREFNGIVFDLGLSSAQLSDPRRGFSFRSDSELDMSFGSEEHNGRTLNIINGWPEEEIVKILKDYGEEKFACSIARNIVKTRNSAEIKTTGELVAVIGRAVPPSYRRGKLHFATRTFQALRIATNDELASLEIVLPQALALLAPGGRMAVVCYHSLEDRMVKRFFRENATGCICPPEFPICNCGHIAAVKILTKKPVTPGRGEIKANPRSRSAKLRAAEKI